MLQIETLRLRVLLGLLDDQLKRDAIANLSAVVKSGDGECGPVRLGSVCSILPSTVELFDNRDFKTLPNHQSKGQPSIWEQTQMGPKIRVGSCHPGCVSQAELILIDTFRPRGSAPSRRHIRTSSALKRSSLR